jgi:hypothetical protein
MRSNYDGNALPAPLDICLDPDAPPPSMTNAG